MLERAAFILKIHPGEGKLLARLVCIMLLVAAGSALGGASIDALFIARVGVSALPVWFIVMGVVNFFNLMLVSGLVTRMDRARLYRSLPLLLAGLLGLTRLLLALGQRWLYPILFIGEGVFIALQSIFLWGLAGSLLDARQAKRLFPLCTAGSISGAMIGSFATPLLVGWFGAETMLLAWSFGLVLAWFLSQALIRRGQARFTAISSASRRPTSSPQPQGRLSQQSGEDKRRDSRSADKMQGLRALLEDIQAGYTYARKSKLLTWLSLGNLVFSVLWFSLFLPFSRLSAAQYPDANRLASFFGLFQGAWTSVALFTSLFAAGRLFSRFGVMNMLVVYPLIYLAGFTTLAVFPAFSTVVAARFAQLSWAQGIAETAWQAALNAVPAERRDQARSFITALPGQFGIVLAGLILLIGQQALQTRQLFLVGVAAAALCSWTMWRARKAYAGALTEALRNGQPQVFFTEDEPFGGFQHDPAAQEVLLAGLASPDAGMRRLSAEILGNLPNSKTRQALLSGLHDPDAEVREACLAALPGVYSQTARPSSAELAVLLECLDDPQPGVRRQAVQTLLLLSGAGLQVQSRLAALLEDPHPAVQAQAALALIKTGQPSPAMHALHRLASSPHPETRCRAIAALSVSSQDSEIGSDTSWGILQAGLGDPSPAVRQAVLQGVGSNPPAGFLQAVVRALGDDNPSLRQSAAAALGRVGAPALPLLLKALGKPELESGVLHSLEYFNDIQVENELRAYISRKTAAALFDEQRLSSWQGAASDRLALLVDSLRLHARRQAMLALRAFKLLNRLSLNSQDGLDSIDLVLDGLQSSDPALSAYAMESLEASENSQLIRPLIGLWESQELAKRASLPHAQALLLLLDDPDVWLRACAIFAAASEPDPEIQSRLRQLAETDPDPWVRQTAVQALSKGEHMPTLPTLTSMERILFLRRVPLFAGLEPADLKQVAEISLERFYPDGELIARQGDPGDELYIILSGTVRVFTVDGDQLAMRKPGEYVGEMALLDRMPRMASLSASGDTHLICIHQKDFEAILSQRPAISLAVIHVLCERLRHLVNP
jgi:HEAT repeat protein